MNFGDIYALVLKEYPDILTVDEMSKALGVSTKTGYQLLRENKIEHLKVGRAYKVPKMCIRDSFCAGIFCHSKSRQKFQDKKGRKAYERL